MNKKNVIKNSLWLTGSQIAGRIIGFLYFLFLARYFSIQDFGILSWVLGFGYNFYPLVDFGIQNYVFKHLSRSPKQKQKFLKKLLPLRLLIAVITLFLSTFLAFTLQVSWTKIGYVFIFGLALLPFNLIHLYASIKNALGNSKGYVLINFFQVLIYASLGAFGVLSGFGLKSVFIAQILSNLILLSFVLFKNKNFFQNWNFDFQFWRKVIKESWVFCALALIAVFYLRLGLIMTGWLLGDYYAGIYGAASKFIEAGILIPQSIALALFPSFSKALFESKNNLKKQYFKILKILAGLGTLVGLVIWFLGKYIILIAYGYKYLEAVPIFRLMGVLLFLFFINVLAGNVIQNSNKAKKYLKFNLINFLLAFIGSLFLIPKLGPIGAVWAMIIGETYGLIVNNYFVIIIVNKE